MKKTYKISEHKVNHPNLGLLIKQKIQYFINDKLECEEFYSEGTKIRDGYYLDGAKEEKHILKMFKELAPEEISELKDLLK